IMDQDGANVRYLTRGDDLVLTPRFSPSTQEITYMAYGQGDPRVFLYNIETGQREIVGNFPGMSFSPRVSPDGQRVIMSLQEGSNSSLCLLDLPSKAAARVESFSDGFAFQSDDPAHRQPGNRYGALLCARRRKDLLRVGPRWPAADLCDGRDRGLRAAHQLWRWKLFHAGLVASRRLHRIHPAVAG